MTEGDETTGTRECADISPQGRFAGKAIRCELSSGHEGLHRFSQAAMRAFWSHASVREPTAALN